MGNGSPYTNQYTLHAELLASGAQPEFEPADGRQLRRACPATGWCTTHAYLRLKNISASYTFDMRKVTKNRLRDIRVSVSGENLYLWKKYNGFDPDVSTSSSNSALRRVDIGAYPKPRTIIFSLQIRY